MSLPSADCGPLGAISCLSLGGGGLGLVWGPSTREEAVLTLRQAVLGPAQVTLLDMAPLYGHSREAEHDVGRAFPLPGGPGGGEGPPLPAAVKVLTKVYIGNVAPGAVEARVRASVLKSRAAMQLAPDRPLDVLLLHSPLVPDGWQAPALHLGGAHDVDSATRWRTYAEGWMPACAKLQGEGLIAHWGITGLGEPDTVLRALDPAGAPRGVLPRVVEVVTNCMDALGSLKRCRGAPRPREILAAAAARGVTVLGIRAVAGGSLCDTMDRELEVDTPEHVDWCRARRFRTLAGDMGVSAAFLAHRYALGLVAAATAVAAENGGGGGGGSVVLGVKNRVELDECVAAAMAGPLSAADMAAVDQTMALALL